MLDSDPIDSQPFVDPRDRQHIQAEPDAEQRAAMLCSVTAYRRPDKLAVGDPVPPLELAKLGSAATVNLAALCNRPLVLFFGSYT